MTDREALERIARELPLPAEDREAVVAQARSFLETIAVLDELPLDSVEPAPVFRP